MLQEGSNVLPGQWDEMKKSLFGVGPYGVRLFASKRETALHVLHIVHDGHSQDYSCQHTDESSWKKRDDFSPNLVLALEYMIPNYGLNWRRWRYSCFLGEVLARKRSSPSSRRY